MKLTKKKVFVSALALCLIAVISMGTLAWFSDSDSITNKFQIADSDDNTADKIFSIDVWENSPEMDEDQDGYTYEEILPGSLLKKEARVENTGHYDQYVRVIVTVSDAAAWINALGADFNAATLFEGFDASKWNHIWNNLSEANGTIPEDLVYVMYYNDKLPSEGVIELFDNIRIPTSLTQEQAAAFAHEFTVDIKAQAVQTENIKMEVGGVEVLVDNAYDAFKALNFGIGQEYVPTV